MPNCTDGTVEFGRVGRRVLQAAFGGGEIVSDGGMLLVEAVDERLGLTRAAALRLGVEGRGASIQQSVHSLLAQRLRSLAGPVGRVRPQRAAQRSDDADGRGPCRAAGESADPQPPGDGGHSRTCSGTTRSADAAVHRQPHQATQGTGARCRCHPCATARRAGARPLPRLPRQLPLSRAAFVQCP